MIYWTWRYLEASRAPAATRAGRLRREIEEAMGRAEPFPKAVDFLNNLSLMTAGVPGIFRWAREEYLARFLTTPLFSLGAQFSDALLDLFFPAQLLIRPGRDRSSLKWPEEGWRRGRRRISGKRLRSIEMLKSQGMSNRAIAHRLGVSEKAIRKLVGPSKPADSAQLAFIGITTAAAGKPPATRVPSATSTGDDADRATG